MPYGPEVIMRYMVLQSTSWKDKSRSIAAAGSQFDESLDIFKVEDSVRAVFASTN